MGNLKVEGKASDWCPKCKNCKGTTREGNGLHNWLTEIECEDPYDGMIKTLQADSDICCSMFEAKPDRSCNKCERFDGTYCHDPNDTITISYMALFGEPVNCPSFEEKEKEPFNLNMPREALEAKILDLFEEKNRLNGIINSLEKEKDKKISELEDRVKYWSNIATGNADKITKFKKDRDKWRSLYNSLSETCADYDKRSKEECEKKYRDEISKLQNIVTEKEVEIKRLKKEIINLGFDRVTVKDIMKKNSELNQTISDQEITIKALLITIKEMCKEET